MPLTLTRPELQRSANFNAGQWQPADGAMLAVTDPATSDAITLVPDSGAAEALAAEAAKAPRTAWTITCTPSISVRGCSTEPPLASGRRTGPGDWPEMPLERFSTI